MEVAVKDGVTVKVIVGEIGTVGGAEQAASRTSTVMIKKYRMGCLRFVIKSLYSCGKAIVSKSFRTGINPRANHTKPTKVGWAEISY